MNTKLLLATAVACLLCASVTMAQTVPSYVPTNGLVGWWPFNGNANDESGNGNHGVINLGGTGLQPTLANDRNNTPNSAYFFPGSGAHITLPASSINVIVNSFTYSLWLKQSFINDFLCFIDPTYSGKIGMLSPNSSGLRAYDGNSFYVDAIDPSISQNNWKNVTIIYLNQSISIFINGVLITQSPAPSQMTYINGQTKLGFYSGFIYSYQGLMDDVGFWNRALTQQEVTALYSAQPCTKPNPVSLGTSMTTELCPNDSVTIKIVSPADSVNYTYQWTRNGSTLTGATTRSITVNDAAKYKVFVSSGPGVDCRRASGLVETTPATPPSIVISAPNGTGLCPGDSVMIIVTTSVPTGYNLQWRRFGSNLTGSVNDTIYVSQTGIFTCAISNAGGCISISNKITITNGTSCRIMGETNSDVSVYPNPAKNSFTVSFNDIGNETPVSVSLRSMQGQVIENRKLASKEDVQLAVGKLSPGLYTVSILLDSGDSIEKTVVVE